MTQLGLRRTFVSPNSCPPHDLLSCSQLSRVVLQPGCRSLNLPERCCSCLRDVCWLYQLNAHWGPCFQPESHFLTAEFIWPFCESPFVEGYSA